MTAALEATELGRARWLRAIVAYDGTDFSGFQVQRSRGGQRTGSCTPRTVQGALEDALAQILQKPTSLLAAGRTDSGVHAVGQVVAFGADWDRPLADLHRALNAVLPDDVAVRTLAPAVPGFHPRYDALSRTYCYTIWNHPRRHPLLRRTALWVRQPLSLEAMNEAAQLLVGRHDFCTFGSAPRTTRRGDARGRARGAQPVTVRNIVRAVWAKVDEQHLASWQRTLLREPTTPGGLGRAHASWQGWVEFTIEANAFLYHMVRSIVGTLIQVGRGNWTVPEFASALHGADRALAGPTAAPQGLCLIEVQYGADARHRADAMHRRRTNEPENICSQRGGHNEKVDSRGRRGSKPGPVGFQDRAGAKGQTQTHIQPAP